MRTVNEARKLIAIARELYDNGGLVEGPVSGTVTLSMSWVRVLIEAAERLALAVPAAESPEVIFPVPVRVEHGE